MLAEEELADKLFEGFAIDQGNKLRTEGDYTSFGKKVKETLHDGDTHYNIVAFMKELMKGST